LNEEELKRIGAKDGTKGVIKTLNQSFTEALDQPFTKMLLTHGESQLQLKPTQAEIKKKRQIYRKCRDKENDMLKQTASMAVLIEDVSLRSYQRKQLRKQEQQNHTHLILRTCRGTKKVSFVTFETIHQHHHLYKLAKIWRRTSNPWSESRPSGETICPTLWN
jgi:hypothetical protein